MGKRVEPTIYKEKYKTGQEAHEKSSISLNTEEMQIKTMVNYEKTPPRMAKI